jgi:hypothetical protein
MQFSSGQRPRPELTALLPSLAVAIVKAVLANQRLKLDENIPGTQITPDIICQNGLIRFDREYPGSYDFSGYLRIPYLWLLAICATYEDNLLEELQLLDYRELKAKEDDTIPGGFSWSDFEKIMIKLRKIKSHVFNDGDAVTIGQLHRGAIMDQETANISFLNHPARSIHVVLSSLSPRASNIPPC